jgi:hypothetical protein
MTPSTILIPLLLTIIIESVVILVLLRVHWKDVLFYSILINAVTLPPATYLYHEFLHNLLAVEILVIAVETVLIANLFVLPPQRSLILSVSANAVTALTGILLAGIL